jgi:hypothetical protein
MHFELFFRMMLVRLTLLFDFLFRERLFFFNYFKVRASIFPNLFRTRFALFLDRFRVRVVEQPMLNVNLLVIVFYCFLKRVLARLNPDCVLKSLLQKSLAS